MLRSISVCILLSIYSFFCALSFCGRSWLIFLWHSLSYQQCIFWQWDEINCKRSGNKIIKGSAKPLSSFCFTFSVWLSICFLVKNFSLEELRDLLCHQDGYHNLLLSLEPVKTQNKVRLIFSGLPLVVCMFCMLNWSVLICTPPMYPCTWLNEQIVWGSKDSSYLWDKYSGNGWI